ncbi:MAG: hypothetical protein WAX89_05715 [Alphaproteobacteria bacterium]
MTQPTPLLPWQASATLWRQVLDDSVQNWHMFMDGLMTASRQRQHAMMTVAEQAYMCAQSLPSCTTPAAWWKSTNACWQSSQQATQQATQNIQQIYGNTARMLCANNQRTVQSARTLLAQHTQTMQTMANQQLQQQHACAPASTLQQAKGYAQKQAQANQQAQPASQPAPQQAAAPQLKVVKNQPELPLPTSAGYMPKEPNPMANVVALNAPQAATVAVVTNTTEPTQTVSRTASKSSTAASSMARRSVASGRRASGRAPR